MKSEGITGIVCILIMAFFLSVRVGGISTLAAEVAPVGEEGQEAETAPEETPAGEAPAGGDAVAPDAEAGTGETADTEEEWAGNLRIIMRARLRSTPGTTSSIVGTLDEETVVSAVGRLNDANGELWYHIRAEEPSVEGYIKADLAEVIDGDEIGEGEGNQRQPITVKVKSNFALDGGKRLNGEVEAMAQAIEKETYAQDSAETGEGSAFLYRVDINVMILIVLAVITIILLQRLYSKMKMEILRETGLWKKKKTAKQKKAVKKKKETNAAKLRGRDEDTGWEI